MPETRRFPYVLIRLPALIKESDPLATQSLFQFERPKLQCRVNRVGGQSSASQDRNIH